MRLARNRVGRLFDIAGRHRQHFERVPGIKPLGGRQPLLAPILRQRRLIGGSARSCTSASVARIWFEIRGGFNSSSSRRPLPSTRRGDGAGQDGRGIGQARRPSCRNDVRRRAGSHRDESARRRGSRGRWWGDRRTSRGPSEARNRSALSSSRSCSQTCAQIRRADLLAGLDDEFGVEAEPAAARLAHRRQRRHVDAVLALVVGGAAAIDAIADHRRPPRIEIVAPFPDHAVDDVAMPVHQNGRRPTRLSRYSASR